MHGWFFRTFETKSGQLGPTDSSWGVFLGHPWWNARGAGHLWILLDLLRRDGGKRENIMGYILGRL